MKEKPPTPLPLTPLSHSFSEPLPRFTVTSDSCQLDPPEHINITECSSTTKYGFLTEIPYLVGLVQRNRLGQKTEL